MPFIDQHNLLFVHIPKTGGSSVEKKFGIIFNHNEHVAYSHHPRKIDGQYFALQHYTPNLLKRFYPERFEIYKKFTIVRNPYTKCISAYFYQAKGEQLREDYFKKHFRGWLEKFYAVDKVDLLQSEYFENVKYDYVLKTETLSEDFRKMAIELKIDPTLPRENVNKTSHPSSHYLQMLSSESIEFINNFFKKDFELLNYQQKNI